MRQLAPGVAIECDLSTGQSDTYRLTLATGDFIRITVEQEGIDVAATLVRPDGGDLLAVDASDDNYRPETVVWIADAGGSYTLVVRPSSSTVPRGRYAIRVEELRPAAPSDSARVEGERAFERGRALVLPRVASAWPEALTAFEAALAKYRQVGDRRSEMKALIEIGTVQQNLLRLEALDSARRAEQIARDLDDKPATAASLYVKGRAFERVGGDLASALEAYEASTAISRAIGNKKAESASLNAEGIVFGRSGDAERAVARFEKALPLARATNNRLVVSFLLNNMGMAYNDLGEREKALRVYEQALADSRAVNDRDGQVGILNNISGVQRALRHNQQALGLTMQALALSREVGRKEFEATSLNNVGITYYELGDYAKALGYHRDSLAIRRDMSNPSGQAASLEGIGRASQRLGDLDNASVALREALAIRQQIREEYGLGDTLRNLAAVERDRGDLVEALGHVRSAVDLEETLRARITSPELRATFVAAELGKYELFIDLLQAQRRADATGGHAAEALQVSERARARVLLESMLDARVDLREGIDASLLERERSLQKQLSDASAQLSRSLAAKSREGPSSGAAEKLERLTAEYQQLQMEIRAKSPRYAAITQPQPLDAAEIQRSVIDDDTVLLEFALGEERSWLWAVTPRAVTSVELPPRREIDVAARSVYELFTARQKHRGESTSVYAKRVAAADARLGGQTAAVSRMLLGGIARQLNDEWRTKRLAIVATGALEYLPFAALPTPGPRPSSLPLASGHEIVSIPSASVLAVLRREAAGRPPAQRTLVILADPVFDATDPRVASPPPRPASSLNDDTASRAVDAMDFLYARSGLSRLPFSREEANAIAALTGNTDVLKVTDFKASRATVLSGALSGYRIVHLATHGVLDSERPSLSSLILSLVDEHGARQNGYLRLHDIYNMRLDADLVVLSACQTALGKEIKGEGLVGLTRAFIYAGAPRVVASLWQVSDLATAELMKTFYRGMLQQHLPPAAALRAAQLQMSREPRWASPYFWAGFVLQGDWK